MEKSLVKSRYIAAMLLSGAGDAIGYKNGSWEFCFSGESIHKELKKLGGLQKLKIRPPEWIVSDDTVLHLATAEGLSEAKLENKEQYFAEIAKRYKHTVSHDMCGRAAGGTTCNSCHELRPLIENGWRIPFNSKGGGCGAAMRSMCIGLRFPDPNNETCLSEMITYSIETGRMTHHHPTGYLGGLVTALFTSFALGNLPVVSWGRKLLQVLPKAKAYIKKEDWYSSENLNEWDYFVTAWQSYLEKRNISTEDIDTAKFPDNYGVKERDQFYKSLSYCGWGGASGHDAPMIAYDALLACGGSWQKLCNHAMLHGGDSDSTGTIAACWFGARHGTEGVPSCNYQDVEYHQRLINAGEALFRLAHEDHYL